MDDELWESQSPLACKIPNFRDKKRNYHTDTDGGRIKKMMYIISLWLAEKISDSLIPPTSTEKSSNVHPTSY